jgi:uncharacterized membrane protein YkvA (DUF1232 family)
MSSGKLDFYQLLRQRISAWLEERGGVTRHAEILLLAPDLAHLLAKLALDSEVPLSEKARLAGALAYFISPVDIIPELVVGIPGYFDDIALAAYVLNGMINAGYGSLAEKHWAGDGQLLTRVQQVLSASQELVGAKTWERLRTVIDGKGPRS